MEISQNDKQREKRIKKKKKTNRKGYSRTVDNLKGMGLPS